MVFGQRPDPHNVTLAPMNVAIATNDLLVVPSFGRHDGAALSMKSGVRARDRRILTLARSKITNAHTAYRDVILALREAVEESIPAGRIYLLATLPTGPVIGSLVTGVGLTDMNGQPMIVRVRADGAVLTLQSFL